MIGDVLSTAAHDLDYYLDHDECLPGFEDQVRKIRAEIEELRERYDAASLVLPGRAS